MIKDPLTWTQIEKKNCYRLYQATNHWDLDDSKSFHLFMQSILTDEDFLSNNRLRPGMDKEDYDPWKGGT